MITLKSAKRSNEAIGKKTWVNIKANAIDKKPTWRVSKYLRKAIHTTIMIPMGISNNIARMAGSKINWVDIHFQLVLTHI